MPLPRVPFATRDQFPEPLQYVWEALSRDTTTPDPGSVANIFRTLGNNPNLLRGYVRLGNAIWTHCGLDKRTLELTILRCAWLKQHEYEWHQHVRIGRAAGVTDAEINAIGDWRNGSFSAPERAIFAYADALNAGGLPPEDVYNELAAHFDPSTLVGITLLCIFYFATGAFLTAMDVPIEEPFVGWKV